MILILILTFSLVIVLVMGWGEEGVEKDLFSIPPPPSMIDYEVKYKVKKKAKPKDFATFSLKIIHPSHFIYYYCTTILALHISLYLYNSYLCTTKLVLNLAHYFRSKVAKAAKKSEKKQKTKTKTIGQTR